MRLQLADDGLSKGISLKKIARTGKKISLVGPRNAFLALIKLNGFNFAKRLQYNIEQGKGADLFKKWEKLGGKKSALEKAISVGAKKKAPLGDGMSAEPVTVSAILATASAVAVALGEFLKKTRQTWDKEGQDITRLVKGDVGNPLDPDLEQYYAPKETTVSRTLIYGAGAVLLLLVLTRKK